MFKEFPTKNSREQESFSYGTISFDNPICTEVHRLNGSLLFFCHSGSARLHIDNYVHEFVEGMEYTLVPDVNFWFEGFSDDFVMDYIWISSEVFYEITLRFGGAFYDFLYAEPPYQHNEESRPVAESHFRLMRYHYELKDLSFRSQILRNAVQNYFLTLYHWVKDNFTHEQIHGYNAKDRLCKQYIALVAKHFRNNREVRFYAERLCVSSRYLTAVCSSQLNLSAKQLLNQYVTMEIKSLLSTSTMTLQEMAHYFNFNDQAAFTNFFKTQTKQTPTAFRKDTFQK